MDEVGDELAVDDVARQADAVVAGLAQHEGEGDRILLERPGGLGAEAGLGQRGEAAVAEDEQLVRRRQQGLCVGDLDGLERLALDLAERPAPPAATPAGHGWRQDEHEHQHDAEDHEQDLAGAGLHEGG